MKHAANLDTFNQRPGDVLYAKLVERNFVLILIIALSAAIRLPALFSDFSLQQPFALGPSRGGELALPVRAEPPEVGTQECSCWRVTAAAS